MHKVRFAIVIAATIAAPAFGQARGPEVQRYVKVDAPVVALTHVRVIDGTGAAAREDQTIILRNGKIDAVGIAGSVTVPQEAQVLDLRGYTVIPGIVGMHNHLFYSASMLVDSDGNNVPPGRWFAELPFSGPRLYLAAGVTTMRTTGSVEPYGDLNLKKQIDANQIPGPKMDVTGPYLEGAGNLFGQVHTLTGPDDARRQVNYWADQGVTSIKAYMHITRAELGAAIEEAHKRGMKITGHLCSVGYREAVELGIDDFEHGPVLTDAEFFAGKQPDVCPPGRSAAQPWLKMEISSPQVQDLIHFLIAHGVAVTSTLPVFESIVPGRPVLPARVADAMSPESKASYLSAHVRAVPPSGGSSTPFAALFKREMEFELAFAKAGGLLLAGPDPTGIGGVLPGFGDQREIELLVEAGFTPLEAIHIATANGAQYLGQADRIGTIAAGKQADLVVIRGDPSKDIADIEKVEIVFRDGVGFDSQKLIDSVRGQVGIR
ncbi:MAG: amidohydrolase family protein [Candidatus Acidiferrales bacterium]